MRFTGLLSIVVCLLAMPLAQAQWVDRYEVAVRTIETSGDLSEARVALEALLVEQPYPLRELQTSSGEKIAYLPYLQMARIQLAGEDFSEAELSLDISEAFGTWSKQKRQRELYEELRKRIERQRKAVAVAAR